MKTFKVLDLFSGVGGFSYGLEKVRFNGQKVFDTVAFCEVDKMCHKVLKKHWPEVPIFDDVRNLTAEGLESIIECYPEVIVGGFPCQDVSVAGKKRGLIDENGERTRSGLWFEYKRLISEIRPRWIIIENVRNLLSNGLGTVLQDLSDIGYSCSWEVISAASIGGPHLRERVWIIAYSDEFAVRDKSEWATIGWNNVQQSGEAFPGNTSESGEAPSSYSDYFRFWPSFTSEEEKSEWWTEASSEFRRWWKTQSDLCGVYDGLSTRLHENYRRNRIKQLGNSIVPFIAQLHGERIAYHEFNPVGLL